MPASHGHAGREKRREEEKRGMEAGCATPRAGPEMNLTSPLEAVIHVNGHREEWNEHEEEREGEGERERERERAMTIRKKREGG